MCYAKPKIEITEGNLLESTTSSAFCFMFYSPTKVTFETLADPNFHFEFFLMYI